MSTITNQDSNIESTNIVSKEVGRRFYAEEWKQIETQGTELDLTVYESIISFINSITTGMENIEYSMNIKLQDVMGEKIYLKIRNKFSGLVGSEIIDTKEKGKNNKKKIRKKKL